MIMFIVAEIGVNWRGDFDLLEKMLINSKSALGTQAYCNYLLSF